jgi:DNA-binding MarR family transcriptional regulator
MQQVAACSEFQLERWGFDVLVSLRRAGKPYQLSPTHLFSSLLLTSGAMTNRIDRLEAAGLVERLQDPVDRRAVKVSLTKSGLKLVDRAVTVHMEVEGAMIASFSVDDRARFAGLLRVLLQYLEA